MKDNLHRPMSRKEAQAALDAFRAACASARERLAELAAELERIASNANLLTAEDVRADPAMTRAFITYTDAELDARIDQVLG